MICTESYIPNTATEAALWEARLMGAHRVIRDLLQHAVYDAERNDACIEAVVAAHRELYR